MDVVGGFVLADVAKALTGVNDHSRFCVSAHQQQRRVVIAQPQSARHCVSAHPERAKPRPCVLTPNM